MCLNGMFDAVLLWRSLMDCMKPHLSSHARCTLLPLPTKLFDSLLCNMDLHAGHHERMKVWHAIEKAGSTPDEIVLAFGTMGLRAGIHEPSGTP